MTDVKIKHCVGVFICNPEGKIYLMRSPKWRNPATGNFGEAWTIPGGRIEIKPDGTEELPIETLTREIEREELKVKLAKIKYIGKRTKLPSTDFIDPTVQFEFEDFLAATDTTEVQEDEREIISDQEAKWYALEEIKKLPLVDSTRACLLENEHLIKELIAEVHAEHTIDKR